MIFGLKTAEEIAAQEAFENMPIAQLTVRQLRELVQQIADDAPRRAQAAADRREEELCRMYPGRPRSFPRI